VTRLTTAELDQVERECLADPDCPWSRVKLALVAEVRAARAWSLLDHLHRQRAFSERTFGPGARTRGVVDHIRKELDEILAAPADVSEWIDVVILAFDGAWRSGATPAEIVAALRAKQAKNEARKWPDWRAADPTKAIEHDRSSDAAPAVGGGYATPEARRAEG
jgi:hypothetical protein